MSGYLASFEPAMRQAIAEAKAAGADVPVGAVVLDPAARSSAAAGISARAQQTPPRTPKYWRCARRAVSRGSWRLDDCTLVVTLEPCTMCAGALLAGRVARLVYGAHDPRAGAAGSVWDVLHDPRLGPPVEVLTGVLPTECAAMLRGLFRRARR